MYKRQMGSMKALLGVMVSILPIVGLVGASNLSTAIIILGIGVTLVFVASPRSVSYTHLRTRARLLSVR